MSTGTAAASRPCGSPVKRPCTAATHARQARNVTWTWVRTPAIRPMLNDQRIKHLPRSSREPSRWWSCRAAARAAHAVIELLQLEHAALDVVLLARAQPRGLRISGARPGVGEQRARRVRERGGLGRGHEHAFRAFAHQVLERARRTR